MNHSVSGTGKWRKTVVYVILILWAVISLFPVYWMLTFSLKTNAEIFGENVVGLPREWVWENYKRALNTGNMPRYFLNSLIVAVTTIVITLAASVMATYAMTRLRWKGRKRMNSFFMLGLTIPIHASIVPLYTTLAKIKLLDTLWALIIPYIRPILRVSVIFAITGSLKSFDLIYVLTNGGPSHATEVPSTLMISMLFLRNRYGMGSAIAVMLIVLCFVFALLINMLFKEEK